jgi:4a-hydroxytetrahydrobiopterin dehydratase
VSALSKVEIQQNLKGTSGWSHAGKALHKRFTFKSFIEAIGFVNRIAEVAEKAGHHPDIAVNYNVVTLSLSTHSEGGVTEKDFQLAKEIDELGD